MESSRILEDFPTLTIESNGFILEIMESLTFERDKPMLNRADMSIPLQLF